MESTVTPLTDRPPINCTGRVKSAANTVGSKRESAPSFNRQSGGLMSSGCFACIIFSASPASTTPRAAAKDS